MVISSMKKKKKKTLCPASVKSHPRMKPKTDATANNITNNIIDEFNCSSGVFSKTPIDS